MFWADLVGADKVLAGLERHKEHLADGFTISELLREKAVGGGTFN